MGGRRRRSLSGRACSPPPRPTHPFWHPQLVRKKLRACYRDAGVNWQQQCRELAQKYLASIKGVGVYRANAGPNAEPRWEQFNKQK